MKTTSEIIADKELIAYCGLYCGACRNYLKGKCPGCAGNMKAAWCTIRKCCLENDLKSCADCNLMSLDNCKKFNNFVGKVFGIIFNSDRAACIAAIKGKGYDTFAAEMAHSRKPSIGRKR
ncbi:MAG: DUF3795 domain-containing protein [Bacteroidales bacterium]|nr:DUF3795 domain-containing protein [Bacteroidales bacterium]